MFRRRAPERKSWSPAALPGTACGYWRALSHRVTRESDAAKYAKARREKTERILVVDIGEVVDPAEHLELIVDRIVSAKVDRRVARRHDVGLAEVSAVVDPVADPKHGRRQRKRVDRIVDRRDTEFFLRPADQLKPGAGVDRAGHGVVSGDLDSIDDAGGDKTLGALGDVLVDVA